MPRLVRLYIFNVAFGFVLAVLFTAALLALDIGHLRHLVFSTSAGWLAALLLVFFHTLLFAGVQFGIAIMRLAEDQSGPPRGNAKTLIDSARPASCAAIARKR
ncbi:hypothetical protein FQV27_02485 [Paracoccus aurantiacus]|uniref:Uncharacterized protein n=1 Tax=Paracoccus aurantiacus TaxID=2599412 RepID=A0A5C6S8P7_9RHOB|nr:hypothetical protein [Paracoccus aurantiacus]TXB70744.1 hypothetical protein FQV27_02485 [Paracoccus aurantiacus]